MKKLFIAGMLIFGVTLGFAKTTNVVHKSINESKTISESKVYTVKKISYKILSISYSENMQDCTLTTHFTTTEGSSGTITVTSSNCEKAAKLLTAMFAVAGL